MRILHFVGTGLLSATSALARRVVCLLLFLCAGLVPMQPCAGDSGVFEKTGRLGTGRYGHTATLLPNGKVLVAGGSTGFPGGMLLASAELYDPVTGSWTATASLGNARWIHT